ncbi:ORF21 [Ranid herpesvirus 2]|uniref:ORF21 n=1 Tax=Ranid herpesvirus 2 TaxID=389214 RepID=Q14W85_9VIRU|nr:ORF21 [Ranid herpesvirus 2]ABG25680.1 ORF21 [Ranid herpesvirus 2]
MASSVVCGIDVSDLKSELNLAMERARFRHSDWPYLVDALMWHEVGTGRLIVREYTWHCTARAGYMKFCGLPMGTKELLDELRQYAEYKYDMLEPGYKSPRVELYNFVYFLKYHIPNYRKFTETHGVSPLTGYVYDKLHEDVFVDGQIQIKECKRALLIPQALRKQQNDWHTDWKKAYYEHHLDAFNAKRRGDRE